MAAGAPTFTPSSARVASACNTSHRRDTRGLADPEQHIAPHMRSRIETGHVLREGNVPVTEFRAGVIAGSGSISFEMIRFMTELFPIVPGPLWMKNRSQPIAIQNVIDSGRRPTQYIGRRLSICLCARLQCW